jgi:hypothetical protein
MRPSQETDEVETGTRDFALEGGCLLCGGDLQVRVGPAGAATFCMTCRWISHPHMQRADGGIAVTHPAGLIA